MQLSCFCMLLQSARNRSKSTNREQRGSSIALQSEVLHAAKARLLVPKRAYERRPMEILLKITTRTVLPKPGQCCAEVRVVALF